MLAINEKGFGDQKVIELIAKIFLIRYNLNLKYSFKFQISKVEG